MVNLYEFTQTLNVLLVEDDERVLTQLEKFFLRRFKNVDTAANGQEAYEKYLLKLEQNDANEMYDFIFSDICMPKMDGLELLKKIRMTNKDLSIVFATARNESHKILEAINYGVNGYLVKPIDYDLLALKIKEVTSDIYFKREYKKSQEEIEHYKELLNETACITKIDIQGNITFVNEQFCKHFGYEKQELVGKNHLIFKHPDFTEQTYLDILLTISCGDVWQGEIKNVTKNGLMIACMSKVLPIFDDNKNEIIEYVSISYPA